MTEAEIDVALSVGFLEIDKEELDAEGLHRLVVKNGWLLYHEKFCESLAVYRTDGSEKDGFPLSGSKMSRLIVLYDPDRWYVGEGDWK